MYYDKTPVADNLPPTSRGTLQLAHKILLDLVLNIGQKGRVLVMDNYFTSIGLFMSLLDLGIYATGTMRSNRVGIPNICKNTKVFARER